MNHPAAVITVLALVALAPGVSGRSPQQTIDYEDCAEELDDLYDAADDAKDTAEAAATALDNVESAEQEVRSNCATTMSGMQYSCDSARSRLRSARADLESADRAFRSEYDDAFSEMRSVQSECGTPAWMSIVPGVATQHQEACRIVRRFSMLPEAALRDTCTKLGVPTDQCNACLAAR